MELFCCACSRRQFLLRTCATCAVGVPWLKSKQLRAASAEAAARPKIRVVFCEADNSKPIWPNIGYDFAARRRRILEVLNQGAPDIEWLSSIVMDQPNQAAEVLASDSTVQGYLVCVQGLGWSNDLPKLCSSGKPTLLVDNLFGGSGAFLQRQKQIMSAGKPVDWVASSNDQDLVDSARQFRLLQQGKTAAEVAAAFRSTRRGRTPAVTDWICQSDRVELRNWDAAFRQLRDTRLLVVGGGWGGEAFARAAEESTGVKFIALDFKELAAAYDQADRTPGKEFAERWIDGAAKIEEPTRPEIEQSGVMYVAMQNLLKRHAARGISINCLGGFYGGHIKAYPCLGFSQFNNDGLVGGCEGDQMSALTMAVMGAVTGRPGFISDPVIDTATSSIIYAHCVATTRPFGPRGPASAYHIRNHSEDRKGAALQALLPPGYMTTTLEINPVTKQILMHQAKATSNNPSDMACRTKLSAVVKGDIEKLTENWSMGWHRVTFYGDLRDCVTELSQRLHFQLVEEA